MSRKSLDDNSSFQSKKSSSTSPNHDPLDNKKVLNEKNHLLQSLKPYKQTNNYPSPIEQQHNRSRVNLIKILITIFILISITIGMYHIFKYLINEKISKQLITSKTTIIPNEKENNISNNSKKFKR